MKLDEAIELGEEMPHVIETQKLLDLPDAIKLLVEAGKRIRDYRAWGDSWTINKLPGED